MVDVGHEVVKNQGMIFDVRMPPVPNFWAEDITEDVITSRRGRREVSMDPKNVVKRGPITFGDGIGKENSNVLVCPCGPVLMAAFGV